MEFKRKKLRGVRQKVRRIWLSREGYRIVWRREVFGVRVSAAFQACVRVLVPTGFNDDGQLQTREMWDFVNRGRRLHRTMKAAVSECEKHFKLWSKATKCTGIRDLCEVLSRYPSDIPKWITGKLDRRVLATVMDTRPRKKHDLEEDEKPKPEPRPESKTQNRKEEGLNERHRQHLRLRGAATD